MPGYMLEIYQQLNPGLACPKLDARKLYGVIDTTTDEPRQKQQIPLQVYNDHRFRVQKLSRMPGIVSNCDGFKGLFR